VTNAFTAAVQSMQNDLQYMDAISQNMVNVATPGFKRAIPVSNTFGNFLSAAESTTSAALDTTLSPNVRTVVDVTAGPVKQTGRSTDLAIMGEGYFELGTPTGPAYSRAGSFHLDATGRLVGEGSHPVQGLSGDIVLNGSAFAIDANGNVTQDGEFVDQLKQVEFAQPHEMLKGTDGLLRPAHGEGVQASNPQVQVGYLEGSNVSPMREMVTMLETTRHFESAQKLFQGYDEALGTAIQKLGEF